MIFGKKKKKKKNGGPPKRRRRTINEEKSGDVTVSIDSQKSSKSMMDKMMELQMLKMLMGQNTPQQPSPT